MIYEVLDFPIPPAYELLRSNEKIWESKANESTMYLVDHWLNHETETAREWLREYVTQDPRVIMLTMEIQGEPTNPQIGRHIDALKRAFTLNYIIDKGGENAETQVFDSNENLLHSHVCEVGKWYLLETVRLHDVVNLTGLRKMVTICSRPQYWQEQQDILSKLLEGRTIKQL